MSKIFTATTFLLFACATCFGQTSFQGLTPGKSTKAGVERILGQPVKSMSGTLSEYKGPDGIGKVYVQYNDLFSAATVVRIELVCDYPIEPNQHEGCIEFNNNLSFSGHRGRLDALVVEQEGSGVTREQSYYGLPALRVLTERKMGQARVQERVGLYSIELYESVTPKNCTGTFLGTWETNRGRMTLTAMPRANTASGDRVDTKGSYAANNGTVTAVDLFSRLLGEWKDETGGGQFELHLPSAGPRKAFTGTWKRTSGKGPKEGTWEGHCVGAAGGTN